MTDVTKMRDEELLHELNLDYDIVYDELLARLAAGREAQENLAKYDALLRYECSCSHCRWLLEKIDAPAPRDDHA